MNVKETLNNWKAQAELFNLQLRLGKKEAEIAF